MKPGEYAGQAVVNEHGWLAAHKWLVIRRIMQMAILLLFLLGPWFGIWIVKGNMTSSLTLEVLPLTDPYVLLQSLFAGHALFETALIGVVIVIVFYLLVGGRVYCSWVCPVNIVTDTAGWLRRRLDIKGSANFSRSARYWMLAMTLLMAALTGSILWELVNPVTIIHRGIVFGMGFAWLMVAAIFLFDLFISRDGWCGHLCPMGAFYSLLGSRSLIRIKAARREDCDDCMDCFAVCPEQQVIRPALKGADKGISPIITSANCTNCGRCIDVCAREVFQFSTRFSHSIPPQVAGKQEVAQ